MTEIVRRVPGTACPSWVREASARLHDLPGVRSVEVGETWTELRVRLDPDLPPTTIDDLGPPRACHCRAAGRSASVVWGPTEVVEMSSSLLAVVVDCHDPRALAGFWSRALSCEAVERNTDEFLVGDPHGSVTPLYLMKVPEPKVGKNRLHLDLVTEGSLDDEVSRLVDLGARLVEVRHDPGTLDNPDTWAVMEDPETHVFCVSSTSTLSGWY